MSRAERDLLEFSELLRDSTGSDLAALFEGTSRAVLARAPGRLDVMGGFADYSGALVLEQPLGDAVCVAVARAPDDDVRVVSLGPSPPSALGAPGTRRARFDARDFWRACANWQSARRYFDVCAPEARFAAYALGGAVALSERGAKLSAGLRILISSQVPEGRGVSSSAALEVAALSALAELFAVGFEPTELALTCQRAENRVVGAACGAMDQLTAVHGEEGRLLRLLCQPAELQGSVRIAPGLALFGIDSGVSRRVADVAYTRARVAAFMGLRVLAEKLGAKVRNIGSGRVALEADPLGGYLARLEPSALTPELLRDLPEQIGGAEFLARFGGISDPETAIAPELTYPVRAATLHPVEEHARSGELSELIETAASPSDFDRLGALMAASHASYSACGLGSDVVNALVTELSRVGAPGGIYGAKISGGGSGGTVVVLAREDAATRLQQISTAFGASTGKPTRLLSGSSAGAAAFPPRWLEF